jgi:hypothetical protein
MHDWFSTLDDVVDGLAQCEQQFRLRHDRRCTFLTVYGMVSMTLRDRVAQGEFHDNEWVQRYVVACANFYRDALDAYGAGRLDDVPQAWRLCFDTARAGSGLVLQDLLLGLNAHLNNDVPLALRRVSIDPSRDDRRQDHDAVNAVLASVTERAIARLAAVYTTAVADLDDCMADLDELVSTFSPYVARDSAWESALALSNARNPLERALAVKLISSRAAVMARLLLASARTPAFTAACRRLEEGSHWMTLLATLEAVTSGTRASACDGQSST